MSNIRPVLRFYAAYNSTLLRTSRDKLSVPLPGSSSPSHVRQTSYLSFTPSFSENINKIKTTVLQVYIINLLEIWTTNVSCFIQYNSLGLTAASASSKKRFRAWILLHPQSTKIFHTLTVTIHRVLRYLTQSLSPSSGCWDISHTHCLHPQGTMISHTVTVSIFMVLRHLTHSLSPSSECWDISSTLRMKWKSFSETFEYLNYLTWLTHRQNLTEFCRRKTPSFTPCFMF
jgi:hypothetical protein